MRTVSGASGRPSSFCASGGISVSSARRSLSERRRSKAEKLSSMSWPSHLTMKVYSVVSACSSSCSMMLAKEKVARRGEWCAVDDDARVTRA